MKKKLAQRLTSDFGNGFSVDNLENCRKFYLAFSSQPISYAVRRISQKSHAVSDQSKKRNAMSSEFALRFGKNSTSGWGTSPCNIGMTTRPASDIRPDEFIWTGNPAWLRQADRVAKLKYNCRLQN